MLKLEIKNLAFMLLYCSSQFQVSILISPKLLLSNFKFQAVNGYIFLNNYASLTKQSSILLSFRYKIKNGILATTKD